MIRYGLIENGQVKEFRMYPSVLESSQIKHVDGLPVLRQIISVEPQNFNPNTQVQQGPQYTIQDYQILEQFVIKDIVKVGEQYDPNTQDQTGPVITETETQVIKTWTNTDNLDKAKTWKIAQNRNFAQGQIIARIPGATPENFIIKELNLLMEAIHMLKNDPENPALAEMQALRDEIQAIRNYENNLASTINAAQTITQINNVVWNYQPS